MRLDKFLAHAGIGTRKEVKELIRKKRVSVNGVIQKKDDVKIDELKDEVCVDGEVIRYQQFVYYMLNKPQGVVSATEDKVHKTVVDLIKGYDHYHVHPVGRLDKDSSGLILLTNNGDLVNECLRAENGHEKEYIVEVDKKITPEFLNKMSNGVKIYNPVNNSYVVTLPCKIKQINKFKFSIILTQGYNRQIRRMCSAFDYHVRTLKRVRFMNLHLDVEEGKYRLLSDTEIKKLINKK